MNFTIAAQNGYRQGSIASDGNIGLSMDFSKAKKTAQRFASIGSLAFVAACSTAIPKAAPPPIAPTTAAAVNVVATDSDRHRIALLLPMTGKDADVGQSIANATTLATLDTKSSNIRITTYDTALGVQAAAQQAVADGNKLILGPLRKDNVITVANVARLSLIHI